MSAIRKKIFKATAFVLALVVTHVCMSAELARASGSPALFANPAVQGAQPQGRLTTRGNNPVSGNGSNAKSGETIFSGQWIQTPPGVGATVNVPGVGRVDMSPNTNITLTFADGKIDVVLVSGCVTLTADKGVTGSIESGSSTKQTDPAKGSTIDICTPQTPGAAAGAGGAGAAGGGAAAGAATGGLFGLGAAGTIGFIAAAAIITTAAIVGENNRPNPSPVR